MSEPFNDPSAEEAQRDYVLSAIRGASARVKSLGNEIDFVGVSLKYGVITVPVAVKLLEECGGLSWLLPTVADDLLGKARTANFAGEEVKR